MSSHRITELIDKVDNSELIRDEIAAILVVESKEQQSLASAAAEDPRLWALRVFTERSNPWSEFINAPDQLDATPLVNIALDNINYDAKASNVVERQKATAVYHIDCYGYGIAEDDGAGGHTPGDARAATEAQRAYRLVRNILMSAHYTWLGQQGLVWRRWPQSVQVFQPALEGTTLPQVVALRLAFEVDFNEFSPQHVPETLDLVSGSVLRAETGEVYLAADYSGA